MDLLMPPAIDDDNAIDDYFLLKPPTNSVPPATLENSACVATAVSPQCVPLVNKLPPPLPLTKCTHQCRLLLAIADAINDDFLLEPPTYSVPPTTQENFAHAATTACTSIFTPC